MTRPKPLLAIVAIAAITAACAQKDAGSAAGSGSVATIDGRTISRNTFEHYAKGVAGKPAEDLTAEQRDRLLDDLIFSEVIAQQAERSGIAARDETRAAMDLSRLQILQRASEQDYLKDRRPSEEELRAEYDIQIALLDKIQYRTSHIQSVSEEGALEILAQLKAGANFAQLAKARSTDAATRDKGGELEWAGLSSMPGPYAEAVKKLKKGETTPAPVKTEFTYHVIRLLDTRDVPPPAFDSVKDRLARIVEQKKFKAYADGLKAKAKIARTP